jgi:serine/threonine protein kinase
VDRASFEQTYKPDDVLAGRYRVVRVLGAGGMGVVVAARHMELDTLVAIKLLRPEVLSNRDIVARFAAEARAAVRIKSEHVARVTDVGALPDGAPYMVMEHLEGADLADHVERRGPLAREDAVDYVLQACEAIAEAHSLGIVHRDLKPGNLFLSRRPDGSEIVKVLDFGISKSMDTAKGPSGSLTATASVLGSPTYMSPEQLQSSKSVDLRTDVWALGVILHQVLAGDPPFRADTLPELFFAIVQNEPAPLRSVRPDLPPGLEAAIRRCLEKDRTRRFENIGELAVALAPFAPPRSQISVERILRLSPRAAGSANDSGSQTATVQESADWQKKVLSGAAERETHGNWGQTASKPKRSASLLALFGFAALAVLGGAAYGAQLYLARRAQAAPPSSAQAVALAAVPAPAPVLPVQPAKVVPIDTSSAVEIAPTAEAAPAAPLALPQRPASTVLRIRPRPAPRNPPTPAAQATAGSPASTARPAPSPSPTPAATPKSDWEDDRR